MITLEGKRRIYRCTEFVLGDSRSTALHYTVIVFDLAEKRAVEQALGSVREKLQAVLTDAPLGTWMRDNRRGYSFPAELDAALSRRQFELEFQPIVDVVTRAPLGADGSADCNPEQSAPAMEPAEPRLRRA